MKLSKKKLLFIYDHKYPHLWKDGLWAALKLLENNLDITYMNMSSNKLEELNIYDSKKYDIMLGWGAFGSSVDDFIMTLPNHVKDVKVGLCIGGTARTPLKTDNYDVLFYETDYYYPHISYHQNAVKAFGINSDIYKPIKNSIKIWDYLTVGAFSTWKRQWKLLDKKGTKMAIGEIQQDNLEESLPLIGTLMNRGVMISDMVEPEVLTKIYNASKTVYIPADIHGGGERAVLEARACGIPVEVENDNPKLWELIRWEVNGQVPDQNYYAKQLYKGIMSCFKS